MYSRLLRSVLPAIAASCCVAAVAQDTAGPTPSGKVTAQELSAVVEIDGGEAPRGQEITFGSLETQQPVVGVRGKVETARNAGAILFFPEIRCTIVMNTAEVRFRVTRGGDGAAWRFEFDAGLDADSDWLDVYRAVDSPPLAIHLVDGKLDPAGPAGERPIADVTVRGSGRIQRAGSGTFRVTVASGEFGVAAGPAAPRFIGGAGGNSVTVSASGITDAAPDPDIARRLAAARGRVVKSDLLVPFAEVAEETAEGDLEPPSGARTEAAAQPLIAARVADIVPRGAGFTSLALASGGVRPASVPAVASTAEAFLTSGNAALAVVGARLQATRVTAGGGQAAALSINPEVTRRFTLGPR